MSKHQTADIRNVALAGHRASGKTSLADALLFKANAVERRGSVDDKTSASDYADDEHEHHFSIDARVLHLDDHGKHLNLIDTPGYPDFIGAALGSLGAVENVVVVVSAVNGIEVNTRRMFAEAGRRGLARFLVVNKLDGDNVHFMDLVKTLRDTFGKGCVLFNAPIDPGPKFSGVVGVLDSVGDAGRLSRGPGRRPLAAGGRHRRGATTP